MKIFISIFRLFNIGGIESSVINLINEINNEHEITLCVLTDIISKDIVIPKNISIIRGSSILGDGFVSRDFLSYQSIIKKTIRNFRRVKRRIIGANKFILSSIKKIRISEPYDIAIAFINDKYHPNGAMISGGDYDFVIKNINAKKKIAWIHGNPYHEGFTYEICKKVFVDYDAIVNVSENCKNVFDEICPVFKQKSFVIYNMYNINKMKRLAIAGNPYRGYDNDKYRFVTVTRLDNKSKRLDRIINVCFKLINNGYENFNWTIVGDGPFKNELISMIYSKNLMNSIFLIGAKYNPYPYMKDADLYISTSQYESLGMSVREAQILECPVLITNVGPSEELVENDVNGIICENTTKGLYDQIKNILDNPEILVRIKTSLQSKPFTNSVAKKQFNNIICNIKPD